MTSLNIRIPAAMIDALRAQARAQGLELSAHVRSQLAAVLVKPQNIHATAKDAIR